MSQLAAARVPVGFRFHPTDEELVGYYLPKKVGAIKIDLDLICELDLYKLEPWDLQDLCKFQADPSEKQIDYYFFSRKDKKYPTGNRANRATTKGFWKATGRDKPIYAKLGQTLIGMRKTLVFYQGRAPHGVKSDWIMHEFRLDDGPGRPAHEDGGWVVCRVFKKNKNLKMKTEERACSFEEQVGLLLEMGSPDILSGGASGSRGSYAFPDSAFTVKQEVINLEEYNSSGPDQYLNPLSSQIGMNRMETHSMPSTSNFRSLSTCFLSIKKDDYLIDPYSEISFNEFSQPQGNENLEEGISVLENLDWNAICEAPGKDTRCPPAVKNEFSQGDSTTLLQLKRQNSDIFSSLDLWNYSQVAQQM